MTSERDEKLATLIDRVRWLEGPDREVDAAVEDYFKPPVNDGEVVYDVYILPLRYTASLDAVVSLIERELPGGDFDMWSRGTSTKAEVYWSEDNSAKAVHKNRALALLLAFLTAMKEKGQ